MKPFVTVVGLALVVGLLTGCTVNIGTPVQPGPAEPQEPVAPEPATTAPQPEPVTSEDAFLDFMRREAPMTFNEVGEQELIAGGYTVCTFFRDGATGREVVESMATAADAFGDDPTDSLVLIYAAVSNLCPEYSTELDLG
ncbi:DUF732 domain-containing protein [Microbacterium sp. M3]|uniref:DUF732 domain-containing protein n=1 Tax=Microbacterium arthrosphaerae TaxID=792652 RepID=A0ABU4H0S6_9MICO|nr:MULTISPECIES: DUF732 domain-containing protein [Microbacterium]MDW4572908.1 DUF732 domain-containing protein [Microbacterium arthrosphaerae]MDW7606763.1 DUF732 domain-containing protein [Microbacterium sp. M3]